MTVTIHLGSVSEPWLILVLPEPAPHLGHVLHQKAGPFTSKSPKSLEAERGGTNKGLGTRLL